MIWRVVLRNTMYKQIWQNASRNMSESKLPAADKVDSSSANDLGEKHEHFTMSYMLQHNYWGPESYLFEEL